MKCEDLTDEIVEGVDVADDMLNTEDEIDYACDEGIDLPILELAKTKYLDPFLERIEEQDVQQIRLQAHGKSSCKPTTITMVHPYRCKTSPDATKVSSGSST